MPTHRKPTRREALDSDYTALYAVAGLTEALAEVLKNALSDTQHKANEHLTELQQRRADLREQARDSAADARTFVITLPEQVRNLPEATRARLAELQQQALDLRTQAGSTYATLAGRGKRVVEEAAAEAAERVDPVLEKVQEGVSVARRRVGVHVPAPAAPPKASPRPAASNDATTTPRRPTDAEAQAKRRAAAKKAAATRAAKKAATAAANAQADLTDLAD